MENTQSNVANETGVKLAETSRNIAQRSYDRLPRSLRIGIAGVVLGSIAVAGCANAPTHESNRSTVTTAEARANCNTFENANAAADASKYNQNSFLPNGKLNSNSSANSYVHNLFGSKGPLAGNGDLGSLAAINSVLTIPASKGVVNPNSYSYQDAFASSVASFNSGNGGKEAQDKACKQAFVTMTEDGNWNNNWAGAGQVVTEIIPTRNTKNNQIQTGSGTDLVMRQVHLTGALNGVEFKSRTPNQKGYTPVLITNQGNIFIQGVLSIEGSAKNNDQGKNVDTNAASSGETIYIKPNGTQVIVKTGPNGEKTIISTSPNGVTTVTTPGGSGSGGSGNGGGGSGSGSGGSGNGGGGSGSGSGGSGNGGGGTTTTTSPEGSTTTTTVPETTTTTTTSPPTTTTTLPKGPNPGCNPNPPYVIC